MSNRNTPEDGTTRQSSGGEAILGLVGLVLLLGLVGALVGSSSSPSARRPEPWPVARPELRKTWEDEEPPVKKRASSFMRDHVFEIVFGIAVVVGLLTLTVRAVRGSP